MNPFVSIIDNRPHTQLIWLLLGLCALMVEMIKPAHASDVAPVRVDWYQQQIPGRFFPTSLDAMKAYLPIIWQQNGCGGVGWACYPLDGSSFTVTKYPIKHFYSANPPYYWNSYTVNAAVQCPSNATLSIVSERGYVSSVNFPAINIPASCTCYAGVPDATATSCVLQCPAGQQLNAAGTACVVTPVCPAHAHATNLPTPPCACDVGYVWDATQTSCVLDQSCPILPITPLPSAASDACTAALESGNAAQIANLAICPQLTQGMVDAKACLTTKLATLSTTLNLVPPIPLVQTSGIRTLAYQAHLREIWDKMKQLVEDTARTPSLVAACATRRAELAAEKGCDSALGCQSCPASTSGARNHCLAFQPAPATPENAKHAQGKAIDVSGRSTIKPLQAALKKLSPPQTIPQFLVQPLPVCNMSWGGTFGDAVHFSVP